MQGGIVVVTLLRRLHRLGVHDGPRIDLRLTLREPINRGPALGLPFCIPAKAGHRAKEERSKSCVAQTGKLIAPFLREMQSHSALAEAGAAWPNSAMPRLALPSCSIRNGGHMVDLDTGREAVNMRPPHFRSSMYGQRSATHSVSLSLPCPRVIRA